MTPQLFDEQGETHGKKNKKRDKQHDKHGLWNSSTLKSFRFFHSFRMFRRKNFCISEKVPNAYRNFNSIVYGTVTSALFLHDRTTSIFQTNRTLSNHKMLD